MENKNFEVAKDPIKVIEERIKSGERWVKQGHYKDSEARWKQWERNGKYRRCIWDDSWAKGEATFNVNTIHANLQTKRPTLFFRNPKITAKPEKPNFTRDEFGNVVKDAKGFPILIDNYIPAKNLSVKLNYEFREIGYKHQLKATVDDNLCPYGIGWLKWGYTVLTVGGHSNQRDRKISYWCKRVDPRNIVYDPMATSMEDCRWIAERLILTREEAEENGFTIPEGYVCSLPDFLQDRNKKARKGDGSDPDGLIIAWEYHDLVNNTVGWYLIADKEGGISSQAKESTDDPYPFDGSCYQPLVLDKDNDDIIGLSDVEPIEDQALALNRQRTAQVRHVDNFGPLVAYEEGTLDPDMIDGFKKTPFGLFLRIKQGQWGKIQVTSPTPMGNDLYQLSGVHKEEMREGIGITEFQQGSLGNASTKATIGNIVQNSSNLRIEEQRDIIYDFVVDGARKLAAMIQAFSEEEEYLNLVDEPLDEDYVEILKRDYGFNPKIPFLRMSKKDIQGEFNFSFNVEDMVIVPKEVQFQQWTNFLNVIAAGGLVPVLEQEDVSLGKVVEKIADLGGVDLNEVKRGSATMLSAEQENQMFLEGMEVPEPHLKDHDDEHISSHGRAMKELEAQLMQGKAQVESIMAEAQGFQERSNPMNPEEQGLAQQASDSAQAKVQAIVEQMEPIQNMARRMKLHMQAHDMNRQKKDMKATAGGSGPMAQGQPAASQQTQMQAEAM